MTALYKIYRAKDIKPLKNDILVTNMEAGIKKTKSGILLPDDSTFKEENIKPRWCRIWKVGKNVDYVKPGQWVLVEHGRWTFRMKLLLSNEKEPIYFQKIDPESILLVSDEKPDYEEYVEKDLI